MEHEKINLKDVTFLFLVRLDSIERVENTLTSVTFINNHFKTNIEVLECDGFCNSILKRLLPSEIKYTFIEDDDPILHRTRYLNIMLRKVHTPIVSVWDVDVIVPVDQITASIHLLRDNTADFVYPYKKNFLDTTSILRKLFLKKGNDINFLLNHADKMKDLYQPDPIGGAFFAQLKSYLKMGLENESFYGWGIEDGERNSRREAYGMTQRQICGPLFHLTHPRGVNSNFQSPEQDFIKRREYFRSINETNLKQEERYV